MFKVVFNLVSCLLQRPPYDQVNRLVCHPTLPLTVTAHEDRHIRFFDNTTGKLIHSMVAHLDAVTSLAIDPSGLFILSGSEWNIRRWSRQNRDSTRTHPGYFIRLFSFFQVTIVRYGSGIWIRKRVSRRSRRIGRSSTSLSWMSLSIPRNRTSPVQGRTVWPKCSSAKPESLSMERRASRREFKSKSISPTR